ncbi:hypothetical protein [Bradyrhizobium sp. WSM1743]|uniref:hypothetical protein n=1 Tax=Bradyrhizobium sp. WSM1743 TaxID=318996 RepID=UPI0004867AFE|nr:hypothetical protein [Bradyrhizobium sp. WSM1743]
MEGIAILALIAAFLPFLVSLGGRGGVWKFLSFLFCCFSIAGAASIVGVGGSILAWVVAWVFTAIAASARRSEERFAKLERRLLAKQEAAIAASPVELLIRQHEPRQRFVTPRQILALVLVFGLAATLILFGVTSDQATTSSKHHTATENASGTAGVQSESSMANASFAGKANKSLEAVIIARSDGSASPAIVGVTNLPDDTKLMIGLRRKEANYFAQAHAIVEGGQFRSERFTALGKPLPPGNYRLEITMPVASVQTSAVQDIIGKNGERLTGKLVERSPLGIVLNSVTAINVGGPSSRGADEAARRDNDAPMEKWRRDSCQQITQLSAAGRSIAECMAKLSQNN